MGARGSFGPHQDEEDDGGAGHQSPQSGHGSSGVACSTCWPSNSASDRPEGSPWERGQWTTTGIMGGVMEFSQASQLMAPLVQRSRTIRRRRVRWSMKWSIIMIAGRGDVHGAAPVARWS